MTYNKAGTPFYKAAQRIHDPARPDLEELERTYKKPIPDQSLKCRGCCHGDIITYISFSITAIKDDSSLVLTSDPISSLVNVELSALRPPPPPLPKPPKASKTPKPKPPKPDWSVEYKHSKAKNAHAGRNWKHRRLLLPLPTQLTIHLALALEGRLQSLMWVGLRRVHLIKEGTHGKEHSGYVVIVEEGGPLDLTPAFLPATPNLSSPDLSWKLLQCPSLGILSTTRSRSNFSIAVGSCRPTRSGGREYHSTTVFTSISALLATWGWTFTFASTTIKEEDQTRSWNLKTAVLVERRLPDLGLPGATDHYCTMCSAGCLRRSQAAAAGDSRVIISTCQLLKQLLRQLRHREVGYSFIKFPQHREPSTSIVNVPTTAYYCTNSGTEWSP
ncbi:hypothetical protein F5878DRAFT_667643 [Lentinula raphanica]|uniref:Uncharacterized protein n=1 Tax=Lentinula raphanica TaxID=153919 RepID=A0AA38NVL3_9AGAR|nr:hypothetical protein F5878DRAFT_667643 [Lentinula raphanica]